MPLSEQEQRLLDEMERHLMNKDADVVSASRDGRTLSYRNIVYGTILVLVGLGGLIAGVSTGIIAIGVIAFLVMVGGVVLAATPAKGLAAQALPCRIVVLHGPHERPLGPPPRRILTAAHRTTRRAPTERSVLFLCPPAVTRSDTRPRRRPVRELRGARRPGSHSQVEESGVKWCAP